MSADADYFWVAAPLSSNQTLQKYDATGTLITSDSLGSTTVISGNPTSFARDSSGNLAAGGNFASPTEQLRYFDSALSRQWGHSTGFGTLAGSVDFNEDGDVICYFGTGSQSKKFTSAGSLIWNSSATDIPSSHTTVRFDLEGNVIAGNGSSASFGKYDEDGNELWRITSHQCLTHAIAIGPNNELIMGGQSTVTSTSFKVTKWDEDGNLLESDTVANITLNQLAVSPTGRVAVVGRTNNLTPNIGVCMFWEDDWSPGAAYLYTLASSNDSISSAVFRGGQITPWNPLL